MEGIIYLSILLISIAFAIVVIYIAFVLHRVSKTMKTLGSTLGEVEKELEYITPQLRQTVYETDKIVDDIEEKMKSTDSLFATIENVGTSVNSVNQFLRNSNQKLSDEEMQQKTKPFVEGIQWSEVAFLLYSKWKKQQTNENHELGKEG